jgi:protein KTI12
MPMIVITGYPSSGKSTTAERLRIFFESRKKLVHVVSEISFIPKDETKCTVFADSNIEKEVRGSLKSSVIRLLSKDTVVIVDGSNYIKGFRYELWCASKATKTTQCTVYCDVSNEDAWNWNEQRPDEEKYYKDVFDGLVMRYEVPNAAQRWDSPLFLSLADDKNPEQENLNDNQNYDLGKKVYSALYERAPPPPNQSTQNRPLAQAEFLHKVDNLVKHIENGVMQSQQTAVEGDLIRVPGTDEKILWTKRVTRPEIARARRQFMVYLKMRGVDDLNKVHTLFVQYLNTQLFNEGDEVEDR